MAAYTKAGDNKGVDISQIQAWFAAGNFQRANMLAKKNIESSPWPMTFYLAESAGQMGMTDTAWYYYNQIVEHLNNEYFQHNDWLPEYIFASIALHRLHKQQEFQQLLDTTNSRLAGDPWLYFHLAGIYAQTGQEKSAIESLQKAIELGWQPNPLLWLHGTLCEPLLNPLRENEDFKNLVREHFPKYFDVATRVTGQK